LDTGAGDGSFERGCRALQLKVDAVDLDPAVCAEYGWTEIDFFAIPEGRAYAACVGNPPFTHAEGFIEHGLELAPLVCYLLPHLFLGGKSRFDGGIWRRFRYFDPLVERAGFSGPGVKEKKRGKGGQVQHAGCVFDIHHRGEFSGEHLPWGGMRAEKKYLKSLVP
jgi:hypothetical protein